MTGPNEQEAEPHREVEFTLAVSMLDGQRLSTSFMGSVQKGETGAGYAARAVVFAFNERSPGWSEPRRLGDGSRSDPPDPRDREADFETNRGDERVYLQVTRVPTDSTFYHAAHVQGHATMERSVDELADDILRVIVKKGELYTSPQDIALVLDASRVMGYDWGSVLDSFLRRHVSQALSYGFEDIVLVGTERVVRLLGASHPGP
jgi:hypothetical protein